MIDPLRPLSRQCAAMLVILAPMAAPLAWEPAAPAGPGRAARAEAALSALVLRTSEGPRSRDGISLDAVEEHLVRGTWRPPRAGERLVVAGGEARTWRSIGAGEAGWFEDDALEGGYASITVRSSSPRTVLLEGMGHDVVIVGGVLRAGNPYRLADRRSDWEPRFDYSLIPIQLERGRTELLFRCFRGRLKVGLHTIPGEPLLNPRDPTLPDLIVGEATRTVGGMVLVNPSTTPLVGARLTLKPAPGSRLRATSARVPAIPPLGVFKAAFGIEGDPPAAPGRDSFTLELEVPAERTGGTAAFRTVDAAAFELRTVAPEEPRRRTFVSDVDGSVQTYAVLPARGAGGRHPAALVLTLHGAGVDSLNQVSSYAAKSWAHIVAPTNRRPYGYNWEEWGRLDALEVLARARGELDVDEDRVYLTGHSMGGHGTWHIGSLHPDLFAAIGPSAGWLSFWSYRSTAVPGGGSAAGRLLARAAAASDTLALAANLHRLGVYVLHGADDDNVPATESRRMLERLAGFHRDVLGHEEPGQGHWWDLSDGPGTDCVDWPAMFDLFARRARPGPGRIRALTFTTPSPGVSATSDWLAIELQDELWTPSSATIRVDPAARRFTGETHNVARLALDLGALSGTAPEGPVRVDLDGQTLADINAGDVAANVAVAAAPGVAAAGRRLRLERVGGRWRPAGAPDPAQKGPHRYGGLKDAFRHRPLLLYATRGTPEEDAWALARARFDAERFWYQGNGALEVRADVGFDTSADVDRSVVLYGNARSNAAWPALLGGSPVQVLPGLVRIADRSAVGDGYACLFIRPRPGSSIASVAAIAGTGAAGRLLTWSKLYLDPGYPFPDCALFGLDRPGSGPGGLLAAGWFGPDWGVASGEWGWNDSPRAPPGPSTPLATTQGPP